MKRTGRNNYVATYKKQVMVFNSKEHKEYLEDLKELGM